MKNTNVIQMESLFNEVSRKECKENIVDKVFKAYRSENRTVERRIRIPLDLDCVIRAEKINCGKLLEKAVEDYLAFKY